MRTLFKIAILVVLVLAMFPVSVFAAEDTQNTNDIIYLEDGSYITIELVVMESRATNTKTGSKIYRYKDSDGVELWSATLTGTFSYTGSSATCTASSVSVSIISDNWHNISKSASKSGASATGEVTMGKKFLGITINKETVSMRLTCSASGTLS